MLYAPISAAASGQTALVAAKSGFRIRVASYALIAAGAVNVKFQSAANDLTGAFPLAAQAGISSGFAPEDRHEQKGFFETNAGEALNLNLDAAIQVSGHLAYVFVR